MKYVAATMTALMTLCLLAACQEARPQLVLTYSPEDTRITIDGYEAKKYASPHTFEFYKAGKYKLEMSAPGHQPVAMFVDVPVGKTVAQSIHLIPLEEDPALIAVDGPDTDTGPTPEPPTPSPAPHQPRMFTVAVESVPAGAKITCSRPGGSTYTKYGQAPVDIELEATGAWEIVMELEGYRTARRVVVVPAQAKKVILTQILSRLGGDANPPPQVDTAFQLDTEAIDSPPPPPPPPVTHGKLSITSSPRASVSIDGKSIGTTPVTNYSIPAGTHKILLENRELGKRRIKIIEIEPGAHVRLAEEL